MEWITFAIWFGCGYLCKITKDFMWEQRMIKIFERMSDTEKRAIATKFINDKLNREDSNHGNN